MPTKRRVSSKRAPRPSEALPRINVAPRILSAEEKHQLILAHTAQRRPMDPVQRMSLWAGVTVCLVFVIGAWMYTVGSGIKKSLAGPLDENLQGVLDAAKQFDQPNAEEDPNTLQAKLSDVSERLRHLTQERRVIDSMIVQLAASSTPATTSTRPDLFQPRTATSSQP